jgi:ankyrin repeat protein
MVRQGLIATDPGTRAGQADRKTWASCVCLLCDRFLSTDHWLKECDVVALINVTNTLKDGLDAGLLDVTIAGLKLSLDLIADRIRQQAYAGHGHLAALGNCANFLRCLFEHDLLGAHDSPTGRAMLHLIDELGRLEQSGHLSGQAQGLINLASFLKAADRWLVRQTCTGSDAAQVALSRASAVLLTTIGELAASGQQWMRSPLNSSALLSALQHLWQRGLLQREQHVLLNDLLIKLLTQVPHWHGRDTHGLSSMQTLRALVFLIHARSLPFPLLPTDACRQALQALLQPLLQRPPAQPGDEDRLAVLQAVQDGIGIDVITLDDAQPLLQSLLWTAEPIDLARLTQAIRQYGALTDTAELPGDATGEPTTELPPAPTTDPVRQKTRARGVTYRSEPPQSKPPSPMSPRARPRPADDEWVSPRKAARPILIDAVNTTASPLPRTHLASTLPKLTQRHVARDHAGLPPAMKDSARPPTAQPEVKSALQAAPIGADKFTLTQARTEWFALLADAHPKALPRLQELAARYPELLARKAPGKKGQTALFQALTQGCKDIAAWLIHHPLQRFDADTGTLLLDVLNAIGILDKRHLAGIRLLIDALVKDHDRKQQALHAKHMPDAAPLSRKELQNHRAALFRDAEKQSLGRFPELRPMLEEYKLLPVLVPPLISSSDPSLVPSSILSSSPMRPSDKSARYLSATAKPAIADPDSSATVEPDWIAQAENRSETDLLMAAARDGHARMLQRVLNFTVDKDELIFRKDYNGNTALIIAASSGHTEIAVALLSKVSDKDALARIQNLGGVTALMAAAGVGHTQTAMAIMNTVNDKDALAHIKDSFGTTALIQAAANGHTETQSAILQAVSDPDALACVQTKCGTTALMAAAANDHSETVFALLGSVTNRDALAQIRNEESLTVLMMAARDGHARTVKALLNRVDDKDALAMMTDAGSTAALSWAATNGHSEVAHAILSAVSDPDAVARMPGIRGITALILAAGMGHTRTAITILNTVRDKHLLANQQEFQGVTAVRFAMLANYPDTAAAIRNILDRQD